MIKAIKHMLIRHKALGTSFILLFFYTAVLAYASGGPFAPHATLDPSCGPQDAGCYISNGAASGQVLYTGAGLSNTGDAAFTRDPSTHETTIGQQQGSQQAGLTISTTGPNGLPFAGAFRKDSGGDAYAGTADGTGADIPPYLSFFLADDNTGHNQGLLFVAPDNINASAFSQSGAGGKLHLDTGQAQLAVHDAAGKAYGFSAQLNSGSPQVQVMGADGTAYNWPSSDGAQGTALINNGNGSLIWASANPLPPQSGNGGKYLTTDGTNLSWAGGATLLGCTDTLLGNTLLGSNTMGAGACPLSAAYADTAIGSGALQNLVASGAQGSADSRNTAVGDAALVSMTSGTENTAVGYQSGYNAPSTGTVTGNVLAGSDLAYSPGGGSVPFSNNVAIGEGATISGQDNILIGQGASVQGDASDAIVIGQGITSVPSNGLRIGTLISGDQSAGTLTVNGSVAQTGAVSCPLVADAGGVVSCAPSDATLKTDVSDIPYGLDTVMKLHPVQYRFINPVYGKGSQIGFIAQELQQSVPEVVTQGPKYESVNYGELSAVLVAAVQQLNLRVQSLGGLSSVADTSLAGQAAAAIGRFTGLVVGSAGSPGGITLYDTVTGQPWCITMANGDFAKMQGQCGNAAGPAAQQQPAAGAPANSSTTETPPVANASEAAPDISTGTTTTAPQATASPANTTPATGASTTANAPAVNPSPAVTATGTDAAQAAPPATATGTGS